MSNPADEGDERPPTHLRKIAVVLCITAAWLGLSCLLFGAHRVAADFLPLDASPVGPNLLASFVWLPVAFVGGWIGQSVLHHRHMADVRSELDRHHEDLRRTLDDHHARMRDLLAVSDPGPARALDATPADRSI